jgi:hypothetical protein
LQYKHTRSMKRVTRSDKPITSVFLVKSRSGKNVTLVLNLDVA